MIWVIGDIHGMFDPLKRAIESIRDHDDPADPVERLIFIGDYIDHGPSSREVIDLILGLDYETVCLAGNHEDLALRFMYFDEKVAESSGLVWFENGALDTYNSIYDHKDKSKKILKANIIYNECKYYYDDKINLNRYQEIKLPAKYEKFLKELKYSHREVFDIRGREQAFSFFHALPSGGMALREQLVGSYGEFTRLLERKAAEELESVAHMTRGESETLRRDGVCRAHSRALERSHLWNRDYVPGHLFDGNDRFRGHGGEVVVHGHTPTCKYRDYYSLEELRMEGLHGQFEAFPSGTSLPFLFCDAPDSGYGRQGRETFEKGSPNGDFGNLIDYGCDEGHGVEAINIDTGAVLGGALTALGLSDRRLADGHLLLLTVRLSAPQSDEGERVLDRTVHVGHFGGTSR
ncbi:MAG: metallophosphoesterase [Deltaproteobacteria bacterium]|jgi:hypothetical protein|nr:metallophosphoesterase [Deltaproteobacteria bacterium]